MLWVDWFSIWWHSRDTEGGNFKSAGTLGKVLIFIHSVMNISNIPRMLIEVEQVLTIEELLFNTHRRKLKIGKKRVYPNKNFDDSEPVFSTCIDSKLPRSVLSTFGGWLKSLNHVMWGGKEYDTLDSLTRVLNPEEVFAFSYCTIITL